MKKDDVKIKEIKCVSASFKLDVFITIFDFTTLEILNNVHFEVIRFSFDFCFVIENKNGTVVCLSSSMCI